MTLLVRDEADIVAANIDFHLNRGVDFIVAMDNLSVDDTPDILHGFQQRGVLHYIRQTADDYSQHHWVTLMARLSRTEFSADWVINNDADEFWWPEHGDLKQVLADVPPSCGAIFAERTNFPPRPMSDGDFFADVMTVRWRQSLNSLGHPLPPKVCHRAWSDVTVAQGNHSVTRDGQPVSAIAAPITILHFPVRSYGQFANKIAKGGAAYGRNTELSADVGATWRKLYNIWQAGDLEDLFRAEVQDQPTLDRNLAAGKLLRDDRLKRFFLNLPGHAE